MHLLLRETHGLEEGEAAVEPGGQAAPILFLSFSDSDLAAADAAVLPEEFPRQRPERIGRYLHPLSVDLLCERLVAPARVVVLRLGRNAGEFEADVSNHQAVVGAITGAVGMMA